MTQPDQGSLAPATIQGAVITPGNQTVTGPAENTAHDFGQLLKALLTRAGGFHHESDLLAALNVVDKFTRQVTGGRISRETDTAPVEDVTRRVPPGVPGQQPVVPQPVPQIDYDKLAAAMARYAQQPAQPQATGSVTT